VGVPQLLLKYVVAGGKYVTIVQGAVPGEAPLAAVPPEIGSASLADQTVVIISAVDPAFLAMLC